MVVALAVVVVAAVVAVEVRVAAALVVVAAAASVAAAVGLRVVVVASVADASAFLVFFYDILIVGTCTIAQDVACIICTVATCALPWHGS